MAKKTKAEINLTDDAVATLVDECVYLDREIRDKELAKKEMETVLVGVANKRKRDGEKTDGGGWTVELVGHEGNVFQLTQAGPSAASVDPEIIEKYPELDEFYEEKVTYKPMKDALNRMKEALGMDVFKSLKALVTKAGSVRVSYKTKEKAPESH